MNAAKTVGYPINEVLRGLDAVLGQLNKSEEQFKNAVPARISAKVGSRRQKISELQRAAENTNSSIASVQAELIRLQAQGAKIASDMRAETVAISQDEQTIKEDEAKFMAAMQDVKAGYVAERQKLETYGRGV